MSSDSTWLVVLVVAVIGIALGIAAVMVSLALPLLSRNTADMRHHEQRVKTLNGHVIQAIRDAFEDARDENRELMHDVQEVLHELRDVRRSLRDRERAERSPRSDVERDLARTLSSVERVMDVLMRSHPLTRRSLSRRVDEILHELREVQERLGEPAAAPGQTRGPAGGTTPRESPPAAEGGPGGAESGESPAEAEGGPGGASGESPPEAEGPRPEQSPGR